MEPIRVLLGPMPAMHRDILDETFAAQDDILVVGHSASRDALPADVATLAPHVTIVGTESGEWSDEHLALLRAHPPRHLLLVANDARSASLFGLRVHRDDLAELSPRAILAAVRQAPRERGTVASGAIGTSDAPASSEHGSSEHGSSEHGSSEHGSSEHASSERTSSERASSERASSERASSERAS